jgi:hypothetical protein
VEATRSVGSAYDRQASSRSGRRPTPYPDMNPDPETLRKLARRNKANWATQSSEEGDVFEPLPASRKYFSRLADRKAPRNAEGVRIAAPKPAPQERPSGSTFTLDARPNAEMMDSLAARIAADATQPLGDADIAAIPPPTPPPRSPLRRTFSALDTNDSGRVRDRILSADAERRQSSTVTFAPGTNEAGPSNKKKNSRFDSLQTPLGYYVPGGRKLSSDVSASSGPAESASDGSENVSDGSHGSARSNPGQAALNMLRQITRPSTQRSSVVNLGPASSARARDGSRATTGTEEVNPGTAVTNVLNMYPGNPARRSSRRSVTAIPKVADDLGVLPDTDANESVWPVPPRSRRPRTRSLEEVEELDDDDDERSPTDTRAPRLPLPEILPGSRPEVVSQDDDLALNNW